MNELAKRFLNGDVRALSRAITVIEQGRPEAQELLEELASERPGDLAPTVGLTGAPGAGKSTLTSALIGAARRAGRTVAVLAVDPSSPYSGGALLGDRLRMSEFILDPGVFVRSMSARGQLGGLSPRAAEAVWLLRAFGFDEVIVESVGAGQSEHGLAALADTTVVVLTPGAGDSIQLEKAGIVEIADVFAINKADLPGAEAFARAVKAMQSIGPRRVWTPPVVRTIALADDSHVSDLWEAIQGHREHLAAHGPSITAAALVDRVATTVAEQARIWAERQSRLTSAELTSDPQLLIARLLGHLRLSEDLDPITPPVPEVRR